MAALLLLLAAAGDAAAETWTVLWSEDFVAVGEWSLEAHFNNQAGGAENKLSFIASTETAQWLGPTYRSAAGSLWDDSQYDILRIEISNMTFLSDQPTANRQWGWVIADSSQNHVPDASDAIADWFEIKLTNAPCCGVVEWFVHVKDDGAEQAAQHFAIADPDDKEMYANITINTGMKRFWINWSTQSTSGAHTGTWTGDGPFAESNAHRVNIWGYSSTTFIMGWIDDFALYGNQTPGSPPPPPPRRERIQADFGYTVTALGIQFYDRSMGPGEMTNWSWNFGDGYGSRRQYPFHTFMCKGNYTVALEVIDQYGNTGDVSAVVQVKESKPLCGILTRGEQSLTVKAGAAEIDIPTGVFMAVAFVSALSLALRIEIPFFPRTLRVALLVFSAVGIAVTVGLFGQVAVLLGG